MNINRFDTLLGYEKTLIPMRAARALDTLQNVFRYTLRDENNNEVKEVFTEAEFIVYTLQSGRTPEPHQEYPCSKCTVGYCISHETCTKGKTMYYMTDNEYSTQITKTGFDFAQWLITEGLTTFDSVQERIAHVNAETEASKHKAAELERQSQEKAAAEKQAEDDYKQWLQEAVRNYGGLNTPEGEKVLIQRDVWLDVLGEYSENARGLLVLIDNIDKPYCRRNLISRLHNDNLASIKTFECITGIKLAKTYKARKAQLEQITKADYADQPRQYKPRRVSVKTEYDTPFYILNRDGEYVEAIGRLWQHNGCDFYIQKDSKGLYKATEGRTGATFCDPCTTLSKLYDTIKSRIEQMGDTFEANVQRYIERNGLSPLYGKQSNE